MACFLQAMAFNLRAAAFNLRAMAFNLRAMAFNLQAMASNLRAMASNLRSMAFNLRAMAFNLQAMASNLQSWTPGSTPLLWGDSCIRYTWTLGRRPCLFFGGLECGSTSATCTQKPPPVFPTDTDSVARIFRFDAWPGWLARMLGGSDGEKNGPVEVWHLAILPCCIGHVLCKIWHG